MLNKLPTMWETLKDHMLWGLFSWAVWYRSNNLPSLSLTLLICKSWMGAHLPSLSLPLVPAALTFWGALSLPGSLPPLGLCTCYPLYPAHFFLILSPLGSCRPLDLGSSIISLRSLTAETTGSDPSIIDHVSPHLSPMQICMHSCDDFTHVYFLHWTIRSWERDCLNSSPYPRT